MCGIAGMVDLSGQAIDPRVLQAMTDVISYRGPDDEGYVLIDQKSSRIQSFAGIDSPVAVRSNLPLLHPQANAMKANIGLSHRRFAIIDLTAAGHQPLFDRDRTCCLVFNGEIYNYVELREELEAQGVRFYSDSDTEVLLEAYKAWGVKCFERFNGFWGLALYDLRAQRLLLSRDRMGKKPLYWARIASRIYFASEIKSLLKVPEVTETFQVNTNAIWNWCIDSKRDLEFSTFFSGVSSFPSASWSYVDTSFPKRIQPFWEIPQQRMTEKEISIPEATRLVRETLRDAVRVRLRADVPLSVELSGGLDSSVILALAAQVHDDPITAYTVRFSDPRWNEEPFARSVAKRYDVDYRIIDPDLDAFWEQILPFTMLEEEPYHSPNLQVSQLIWSQMRAQGTKVSLNGVLGDELFGGYPQYFPFAQQDNLESRSYWRYLDNAVRYTNRRYKPSLWVRPICRMLGIEGILDRSKKVAGLGDKFYLSDIDHRPQRSVPHTLSEAIYNDLTNTLVPYWLRSGDKSSMGVPFESRSPFFDYRVLEVATQLPGTYLIRHGWHKWILRKAFEDSLPSEVVWRRKKMGFPFPIEMFYEKYADVIEYIFAHSDNPFIDFANAQRLKKDWHAISFVLWYELFVNKKVDLFHKIQEMVKARSHRTNLTYTPAFQKVLQQPACA